MKLKKFGVPAIVMAGLLSVLALGAWATAQADDPTPEDTHYLMHHLQSRSHSADAVWAETSLAEMLPSQRFSVNGAPAAVRTSGLVIGRITDVRAGRGYSHENDAPKGTPVAFDAPNALWRTVEVTVTVEESWGKAAGRDTVTFAVVIDRGADAKKAIKGLRAIEKVVVSLDRQGRYDYAPDVYSISRGGDLLGTVDAHGNIKLPIMDDGAGFMQGVDTVAKLRAAAAGSPQDIKVDVVDGVAARR